MNKTEAHNRIVLDAWLQSGEEGSDLFSSWMSLANACGYSIDSVKTRSVFEQIVGAIKASTEHAEHPKEITRGIHENLFREVGLILSGVGTDASCVLPDKIFRDKKTHCVGLCLLYLCIAEELDLPLSAKVVPGHIFLTYEGEHGEFNIETTAGARNFPNVYYQEMFVPGNAGSPDYYLRTLTKKELFSVFVNALGSSLKNSKRYQRAKEVFAIGLALSPNSPMVLYNMGDLLFTTGEHKKAKRVLLNCLVEDPGNWQAHFDLTRIYFKAGDNSMVISSCETALALMIETIRIPVYLGNKSQSGEADIDVAARELLESSSDIPEAFISLGLRCCVNNKYETAAGLFLRAAELRPADGSICSYLAVTFFRNGRFSKAREYALKARNLLGHTPSNDTAYVMSYQSQVYVIMGKSFIALGQQKKAVEAFRQALAMDPLNSQAQKRLEEIKQ